jgi:hypothetical protein
MKSLISLALLLALAVSIFSTALVAQKPSNEISPVGDWRGDSICQVRPSACHDEDALYHVTAIPGKPGQFSMQADKIVDGKPQNMGNADCTYDTKQRILACNLGRASLEFSVTEKTMSGAMFLPDKTRWRNINLKKAS